MLDMKLFFNILHRKLVGKLVSQILLKVVFVSKSRSMGIMQHAFYVCFGNTTSRLTILNNFTSDPCVSFWGCVTRTGLKEIF